MKKTSAVRDHHLTLIASVLAVLGVNAPLSAVPYASGVHRIGDVVVFTLNETADTVTITQDNGTATVMNNAAAGQHIFVAPQNSNFTISVTNSAPAGWAEISTSVGNPMLNFERANGVAVNKNPGSPNFGRFYVSQRDDTTSQLGRQMGDGIYVFNADATDAFGITDPNDTSAARNAGLDFSGSDSSPFRVSVGPDDTLYISDASDISGGIYYTDPDVTTGGNLLASLGGIQPIVGQNHGSIISTPLVSGSLAGGDLVLYTIDQDLPGSVPNTGSHVWRYDIGGVSSYDGQASLVVDASTLTNGEGDNVLNDFNNGFDTDGSLQVDADIVRDPHTGNFILIQRNSRLIIMNPSLTEVLQIFPLVGRGVAVSPDGGILALRVLGGTWIIRLDEQGLHPIDTNPFIETGFPSPSGYEGGVINPVPARVPITFDLAGNIYTSGNAAGGGERLGIYSPGGDTTAVTRSNGTFTINGTTYGDHLEGDLNNDGFVGIEDLNIVLGNWNLAVAHGVFTLGDPSGDGFVGIEDLNVVLGNWNNGTPPDITANIPEPSSVFIALSWLISLAGRRGRRYR